MTITARKEDNVISAIFIQKYVPAIHGAISQVRCNTTLSSCPQLSIESIRYLTWLEEKEQGKRDKRKNVQKREKKTKKEKNYVIATHNLGSLAAYLFGLRVYEVELL